MQTISRRRLARGAAAGLAAAAIARPAASQARWKWDLPAGYPAVLRPFLRIFSTKQR